ncbi:MAG: hypothetical protein AAGF26_11270, partial [Cyanobacteria bacterium P01_G01_bin.49]
MSQCQRDSVCFGSLINLALIGGLLFSANSYSMGIDDFRLGLDSSMRQQSNLVDSSELDSHKELVEESVNLFHSQFNQGRCSKINQQISKALRASIAQSELSSWCEQFIRQFGMIESTQLIAWDWQNTRKS